jgi:hypothetical protein
MPDEQEKRKPRPHLETRPATMLTAIGDHPTGSGGSGRGLAAADDEG